MLQWGIGVEIMDTQAAARTYNILMSEGRKVVAALLIQEKSMTALQIGAPIPDFSVPSTQGEFSAADLKGKMTVLYFYPKDNTPGCTTESQNFRDALPEFQAAGAQIIGVRATRSVRTNVLSTSKP